MVMTIQRAPKLSSKAAEPRQMQAWFAVPHATVWVGAGYAGAITATPLFHAIAIAGQIAGKYAMFLIGVDSTQPRAIYLLQSN
jgi:hypothetical protein